jgi:hypothetical protein
MSSHILAHEYEPQTQTLRITFRNGATYRYEDVPPARADAFATAFSQGQYFHAAIRPFYKAAKEEQETNDAEQ